MAADIDEASLRAAFDLAIQQLFEDAQLLEAAGLETESTDAFSCAQSLKSMRNKLLRSQVVGSANKKI